MVVEEEEVVVDVTIAGNSWLVQEMEIKRSRYNEVDTVLMRAFPDPDDTEDVVPEYDDAVTIDAGSVSTDAEDASVDDALRVYTGRVTNRRDMTNGLWKIRCSNSILDLTNEKIDLSSVEGAYVFDAARQVANSVGVDFILNVSGDVPPAEVFPGRNNNWYYQRDVGTPVVEDLKVSFEKSQMFAADALDRMAEWAAMTWWVDRYDTLHFGHPNTRVHLLDEPYNHVVGTDAGKKSPPYRSVKVIGDGIVSEEGWSGASQLAESPTVSQGNLPNLTSAVVGPKSQEVEEALSTPEARNALARANFEGGELVEPTYVYKSKEIKTSRQAAHVRDKIMSQLQEQQAGGWVDLVGRPNLGVLDIIEMPDSFGNTNRGEQIPPAAYLVSTILHRFNDNDGFVTRVECGGLAGRYSGEVVEAEDLSVSDTSPKGKESEDTAG